MTPALHTPETRLLDPVWWQGDPQDSYRALLAHDGLWRDADSGYWCVARHGDVLAVERDAERFSSEAHYRVEPSPGETTMIAQDDPDHLAQRRIINRRFTPRATRDHADHYRNLIGSLVDQALETHATHGSIEVVDIRLSSGGRHAGTLHRPVVVQLLRFIRLHISHGLCSRRIAGTASRIFDPHHRLSDRIASADDRRS